MNNSVNIKYKYQLIKKKLKKIVNNKTINYILIIYLILDFLKNLILY